MASEGAGRNMAWKDLEKALSELGRNSQESWEGFREQQGPQKELEDIHMRLLKGYLRTT